MEKVVREARFELAQGCPRQPLKLVRLPFRHSRTYKRSKRPLYRPQRTELHNYKRNLRKTQPFLKKRASDRFFVP